MRRFAAAIAAVVLAITMFGVVSAHGNDKNHKNSFKAHLDGYHEVPANSTTGRGDLRLSLNDAGNQITYTLTYSALQGGAASAAHIHFAQPNVNGGVVAFLCGGGGKPTCPATGGTVSGTIVAADILAVPPQGIGSGDLAAVLRAMRAGMTYANVHTPAFPLGEIRGQIKH